MTTKEITCYSYNAGTLIRLGIVDDFVSFSFKRGYSNIGEWTLVLNGNSLNTQRIKGTQIISAGNGVAGLVYQCDESSSNTNYTVTYTGVELKGIASQRIIMPPEGSAYQSYTNQSPEYVIAQILTQQVINPTDTDRTTAGSIAAYTEGSERITFDGRFDNVGETIQKIASTYDIGWYADIQSGAIVWHIYRGVDRKKSQNTNSRMVVSYGNDSFGDSSTSDIKLLPNVALIAGQGEGVNRATTMVGSGTGLTRSEVYIDARDISDVSLLPARGAEALAGYGDNTTYNTTFSVQFIRQYRNPYELGDIGTIVDSRLPNGEVDFRLTEVTEVYEGNNLRLDATFGYDKQSLKDSIQRSQGSTQALIKTEGGGTDLSEIETAIANKQDKITGVSDAEIGYLANVTSDIQSQINGKAATSHTQAFSTITDKPTTLTGYGITDAEAKNANIQAHIGITAGNPHGTTKANVGLTNVTDNAQVKKIASSVDGNIMAWSGTSGDTPADVGYAASVLAKCVDLQVDYYNSSHQIHNYTITNPMIQIGWGQMAGAAALYLEETITFPEAFDVGTIPIITGNPLGYIATNPATTESGFNTRYAEFIEFYNITNTGCTVTLYQGYNANFATGRYYGYSWTATGQKTR